MRLRRGASCVAGVLLLTPACFSAGSSCAPDEEPCPIVVTFEQGEEEFRDLPTLASGRTQLLGQDVPDSHADVSGIVHIECADHVLVDAISFGARVNDADLDIEIERSRNNDVDFDHGNPIGLAVFEGDIIRVHFRARALTEILQPQGAAYSAIYELQWSEDVPLFEAAQTGSARLETDAVVAAAVNTGSFAIDDTAPRSASLPVAATAAQLRASAKITSGLTVDVNDVRMSAVFFGVADLPPALPALGLALVDDPAVQVAGAAATQVAPSDVVDIFTSPDASAEPAVEGASGTAAATGDVSGGKAVVTIEIDYTPSDGTAGLTTDALAFVVDVE